MHCLTTNCLSLQVSHVAQRVVVAANFDMEEELYEPRSQGEHVSFRANHDSVVPVIGKLRGHPALRWGVVGADLCFAILHELANSEVHEASLTVCTLRDIIIFEIVVQKTRFSHELQGF